MTLKNCVYNLPVFNCENVTNWNQVGQKLFYFYFVKINVSSNCSKDEFTTLRNHATTQYQIKKLNPLVVVPFSWDANGKDLDLQHYFSAILATSHELYKICQSVHSKYTWTISYIFCELPLIIRAQHNVNRCNHIVRECNQLIYPSHCPVRTWIVTTRELDGREVCNNNMRVKVKNITNRSFFVEDKDGTHLIPAGYLEWLKEIYNRAVMEVTDDNANDDFSQ